MGDYYYEQLCDMGFTDECNVIRRAWRESGSEAAYASEEDRPASGRRNERGRPASRGACR